MARWKLEEKYSNTAGRLLVVVRSSHFAVRLTGRLEFYKNGLFWIGIIFDDGRNLWLDNCHTINNDDLHSWRNREGAKHLRAPRPTDPHGFFKEIAFLGNAAVA